MLSGGIWNKNTTDPAGLRMGKRVVAPIREDQSVSF